MNADEIRNELAKAIDKGLEINFSCDEDFLEIIMKNGRLKVFTDSIICIVIESVTGDDEVLIIETNVFAFNIDIK